MRSRLRRAPGTRAPAVRLLLASLAALAGLLVFAVTPALALNGPSHIFTGAFGSATSTPPDPYPLSGPTDVAVDQTSHDVYVTDPGNYRIEKFSPTGEFLLMFGKGVNKTAVEKPGSTEVEKNACTKTEICQSGSPGSASSGFELPEYLAVDNSGGPSAGDVYVADNGTFLVKKFDASGHLVTSWGESGHKNGEDEKEDTHAAGPFGQTIGIDVSSATGALYIGNYANTAVYEYTQDGTPIVRTFAGWAGIGPGLFSVDSAGNFFLISEVFQAEDPREVFEVPVPAEGEPEISQAGPITSTGPSTGFSLDPSDHELYQGSANGEPPELKIYHYAAFCKPRVHESAGNHEPERSNCAPLDAFGEGHLSEPVGMDVDGSSHSVYVANSGDGEVAIFGDIRPAVPTTGPASEIGETTATLSGGVGPGASGGSITQCVFEYGIDETYGRSVPCSPDPAANPPGSNFNGPTSVTGSLSGLTPLPDLPFGSQYHYRLFVTNEQGASALGRDRTFTTTAAPRVEGLSTSHVTPSSAELDAAVNTNGLDTTYRFEYGTTSAYGNIAPVPDGTVGASQTIQHIAVPITGLQGVTYHFRLVVENALGSATSEDQTFQFFPPGCPNSAVRQQTGSAYLPDCRAYELVSPGNANGTLLYSGGPNTGQATSPSRFSFTGNGNSLKGANTIETAADLYTATRTESGWESRYIGLPGDQAGCMGGPPNAPTSHVAFSSPPYLTNTVLSDTSMSRLLIWLDGTPINCFPGRSPFYDNNWELASPSNAPYMYNADGSLNQRLPTSFPGGSEAVEALKCPYPNLDYVTPPCTGDVTASADLSHFVFSSNKASLAQGGVEGAPGSAYDNNVATNTVSLISLDSAGNPIAQDPSFANVPPDCSGACQTDAHGNITSVIEARGGKEEFIRFPAVSTDGSHILMSTATARTHDCNRGQSEPTPCERFTDTPIHLYMRVNDAISYEPSRGEDGVNHAVKFLGMTPGGSKVFFTSEEQLIAADKDTSTDLYMWSEATDSLSLVSKGNNPGESGEAGQSDSCNASWTAKCGAQPYSNYQWTLLPGGEGGNGIADSAITPSGDIYFYSPEQLDGGKGLLGGQNLYDYREGKAQFVATFEPEQKCRPASPGWAILCAEGPILRFEATPDDSRAAFLTTTQLTSYDNGGHIEMYSYTPANGEIVCDSCRPDGKAPSDDVKASQDGRYLTNDGRVFFSTADPLVAQDTNEGIDVYEFVDGRPQLITPGTGTAAVADTVLNVSGFAEKPGLVGVSNDGTDVYFATFDTLTAEDHNGNFFKFYDARVNGGFVQPAPVPPCAAAEECHGAGSSAPQLPTQGTAAGISGGNVNHKAKKHKAKKHKKAALKHHRARAAKNTGRAAK
ncbi:MAG: hypothetical protein H0X42_04260 [Solirubrobacterales bacterium]|nr:hypothetical protein [Solirubrobacterales bacterium]